MRPNDHLSHRRAGEDLPMLLLLRLKLHGMHALPPLRELLLFLLGGSQCLDHPVHHRTDNRLDHQILLDAGFVASIRHKRRFGLGASPDASAVPAATVLGSVHQPPGLLRGVFAHDSPGVQLGLAHLWPAALHGDNLPVATQYGLHGRRHLHRQLQVRVSIRHSPVVLVRSPLGLGCQQDEVAFDPYAELLEGDANGFFGFEGHGAAEASHGPAATPARLNGDEAQVVGDARLALVPQLGPRVGEGEDGQQKVEEHQVEEEEHHDVEGPGQESVGEHAVDACALDGVVELPEVAGDPELEHKKEG
eukprot:scaffold86993_cov40-Prasinocladus_malaysianus.AAC.2